MDHVGEITVGPERHAPGTFWPVTINPGLDIADQ
jgi:hypothetical protein